MSQQFSPLSDQMEQELREESLLREFAFQKSQKQENFDSSEMIKQFDLSSSIKNKQHKDLPRPRRLICQQDGTVHVNVGAHTYEYLDIPSYLKESHELLVLSSREK
ncbi:hypothetical protein FGO68_gene16615 [Halteria grandinella]|uniref:Uncharacterized protein n=1 Tax=Halteria grandinella TaxID=5974 RepID=A0A8J8NU31_HALGN|nr:hypothetical protein FGO68_gene16615 [Halteria grandinella]